MRSMVEGGERANKSQCHCEERSDEAIDRFPSDERWIAHMGNFGSRAAFNVT